MITREEVQHWKASKQPQTGLITRESVQAWKAKRQGMGVSEPQASLSQAAPAALPIRSRDLFDYRQPAAADATRVDPTYINEARPAPYQFKGSRPWQLGIIPPGTTEKIIPPIERKPGVTGVPSNVVLGLRDFLGVPLQAIEDPIGMAKELPHMVGSAYKRLHDLTPMHMGGSVMPGAQEKALKELGEQPLETAIGLTMPLSLLKGGAGRLSRAKTGPVATNVPKITEKLPPAETPQVVEGQGAGQIKPQYKEPINVKTKPAAAEEAQVAKAQEGQKVGKAFDTGRKQSYEMSLAEYTEHAKQQVANIERIIAESPRTTGRYKPILKGWKEVVADPARHHREAVRGALRVKKSEVPIEDYLPPEVLADYPDLAAKYGLKKGTTVPEKGTKPAPAPVGETLPPKAPGAAKAPKAAPAKPKKAETATEAEPDLIGLKKVENERLRDQMAIKPLKPVEKRSFQRAADEADAGGLRDKAIDIADEVNRTDRTITDSEFVGMSQKASDLSKDYEAAIRKSSELEVAGDKAGAATEYKRAEWLRSQQEKILDAVDKSGSEQARNFAIRRTMTDRQTYELVDVMREFQKRKGVAVTRAETIRFEKLTRELKEASDRAIEMEGKWQESEARRMKSDAEIVARIEIKKAQISRKAAGSREAILAERADLKKQLADMGFRMHTMIGIDPYAAHLVGKLTVNYLKEGAVNLSEAVKLVLADFPELTEHDVYRAMNTRNPRIQRKLRTEVDRKIAQAKTQARLLTELEAAEGGVFTPTKARPVQLGSIKQLRSKLRELRRAAYKEGNSDMQASLLERTLRKIDEAQDQIANQYRAVKKQKSLPSEEVAKARQNLADIRKAMGVEDKLADLREQLRTGEFRSTAERMRRPIPEELERQQVEARRLRRQIDGLIEGAKPWFDPSKAKYHPFNIARVAGRAVSESFTASRAVLGSTDVSGMLRQAVMVTPFEALWHPGQTGKLAAKSVAGMFRKYKAEQIDNAIRTHPKAYLAEENRLFRDFEGPLTNRMEIFRSNLIEKVPVVGHVVKASNRHMTTYINGLRANQFYRFLDANPNATRAEIKAWAYCLKVLTGEGQFGAQGAALSVLNKVYWAPKLALSRAQTPYLLWKYRKMPRIRRELAKIFATDVALATTIMTLVKMNGGEVGDDPHNADWGKVKVGDTRIDIWGGFQQPARLLTMAAVGYSDKQGWTEAERDFDLLDAAERFLSYKMAPNITFALALYGGKTMVGEPVTPSDAALRAYAPLILQDVRDAYKSENKLPPAATFGLAALGVGVNTYPDSEAVTRNKIRELKDAGKSDEATAMKKAWNAKQTDPDKKISDVKRSRVLTFEAAVKLKKAGNLKAAEEKRNRWNDKHPTERILKNAEGGYYYEVKK